jgi:ABC-type Zn2+ transport system substrate-binding protein/surface adhesin
MASMLTMILTSLLVVCPGELADAETLLQKSQQQLASCDDDDDIDKGDDDDDDDDDDDQAKDDNGGDDETFLMSFPMMCPGELADAETLLQKSQQRLASCEAELAEIDDKVSRMKREFAERTREVNLCMTYTALTIGVREDSVGSTIGLWNPCNDTNGFTRAQ